jgi:hypothetical protein
MRRLILFTGLALLAAGAGLVVAQPREDAPARAADKPAIAITGKVEGLYPGASKRIRLKLNNRSRRTLVIKSVRARVKSPGGGCSARSLQAKRKRVRIRVPGRKSRKLRYPIKMRATAVDACQGERFPLRYRARVQR